MRRLIQGLGVSVEAMKNGVFGMQANCSMNSSSMIGKSTVLQGIYSCPRLTFVCGLKVWDDSQNGSHKYALFCCEMDGLISAAVNVSSGFASYGSPYVGV